MAILPVGVNLSGEELQKSARKLAQRVLENACIGIVKLFAVHEFKAGDSLC